MCVQESTNGVILLGYKQSPFDKIFDFNFEKIPNFVWFSQRSSRHSEMSL
jgi:hypothetical protein